MRVLDGEQVLMRVFVGEGDKHHGKPVYQALVEMLQKATILLRILFQCLSRLESMLTRYPRCRFRFRDQEAEGRSSSLEIRNLEFRICLRFRV